MGSVARMNNSRALPAALLALVIPAFFVVGGPLLGLLLNIPWARAWELVAAPEVLTSLVLSLGTAAIATLLSTLLGVPLALWLVQLECRLPRVAQLAQLLVYAPLVLSPVVSGLALIYFWGRQGLLGSLLHSAGVNIAYTTSGVVAVQVFVSMPFLVATAVTALRDIPQSVTDAAAVDGAGRWQRLWLVVLPLAWPGILVGLVLAFARSLGEYGATLTFAGNVAGQTRTIPLLIELGLSSNDMDRALGACLVLLGVYVLVVGAVVLARWRVGAR